MKKLTYAEGGPLHEEDDRASRCLRRTRQGRAFPILALITLLLTLIFTILFIIEDDMSARKMVQTLEKREQKTREAVVALEKERDYLNREIQNLENSQIESKEKLLTAENIQKLYRKEVAKLKSELTTMRAQQQQQQQQAIVEPGESSVSTSS